MALNFPIQSKVRDYKRERMESVCKELIDEGDLNVLILKLQQMRGFNETERLWIIWKVAQIQAGRNIVHIAIKGLSIMGVGLE